LVPNKGWIVNNDTDLLWVTDFGLAAGARYTVTAAFYDARHYAPGEADQGLNPTMHRLGPLVAYTFYHDPAGTKINDPTVLLLVNWWLSHRYRTGRENPTALPYIAVGFLFRGDLLAVEHPH